jgi:hypothetical protein
MPRGSDQTRRSPDHLKRAVHSQAVVPESIMGELERVFPDDLKKAAVSCGRELVLPYAEALSGIAIATEHLIAVLGLESFEVRQDGLQPVDYSGYDRNIAFTGDWKTYVAAINSEAERWISEHRVGENHGYILTSASESEFASLSDRLK